jgi:hypothetical protein
MRARVIGVTMGGLQRAMAKGLAATLFFRAGVERSSAETFIERSAE